MQAIHVPTAQRADLLDKFTELPTDELRGILVRRAAEMGAEFVPGRVENMNGKPGPAKQLNGHTNGHALPPVKTKPRRPSVVKTTGRGHAQALQDVELESVLAAVARGHSARKEIVSATGLTDSRVAVALNRLREQGRAFLYGSRRFGRWGTTEAAAKKAHAAANKSGDGPKPKRGRARAKVRRGRKK